ncbi:MAG: response regulator [Deltaproteobacteria bacterium]|nr:MAG: response regulator [Deltaproteobacteria bacterium]
MKILIVDDSKTMRMIVRRTIRQAGYDSAEVVEAPDGTDALDMLAKQSFDLVLSDWNMLKMNGPDMLDALNKRGQAVPVGFVTSEGSDEMRLRATELGAKFLIAKPFTPETFREKIDLVLKH